MGKRTRKQRKQRAQASTAPLSATAEVDDLTKPHSALATLDAKRQAFVRHYCGLAGDDPRAWWNGAAAARAAGYSAATAKEIAYELLRTESVQAAVDEVLAGLRVQHAALTRRAIEELTMATFTRLSDVLHLDSGGLTVRDDIPPEAWAAISEVTETPTEWGRALKVKLHSKASMMSLLLKAIGHLQDGARGPSVNVVQVNEAPNGSSDGGLLTRDKIEKVRAILGMRAPVVVEAEPSEPSEE